MATDTTIPAAWLPLRKLARASGIPEKTFRRRMLALNIELGGKLLRRQSRTGNGGRWLVDRAVFEQHERPSRTPASATPKSFEEQLAEHAKRLDVLDRRLQTVRDGQIRLRGRVARVEDALKGTP